MPYEQNNAVCEINKSYYNKYLETKFHALRDMSETCFPDGQWPDHFWLLPNVNYDADGSP